MLDPMMNIFRNKPKRWSRRDLILFLDRLELYVSSGVTVDKALEIVVRGVSKSQRPSIEIVRRIVESGGSLSRALHKNARLSATLASLIEHGESSGDLTGALRYARSLLEREEELIKKCVSALIYPFTIGLMALILTVGLMRGVMPHIIPMLKSLHVQLPFLTRAVVFLSESFITLGVYALVITIAGVGGYLFLYRRSRKARLICQSLFLRLPLVGRLATMYFASLFARSLGSLIESGVSVAVAYASAVSGLSCEPFKKSWMVHTTSISHGMALGSVMATIGGLPTYISSLALAGEASGSLGTSLIRAADIVDRDIDHALKRLTSLIEPVMMAGMGCVIGGIALSIMIPIYDVSKVLQQ